MAFVRLIEWVPYKAVSSPIPATHSDNRRAYWRLVKGAKPTHVEDVDDYLIAHSAVTYLMAPDGRFLRVFDHGTDPGAMASAIRRQMNSWLGEKRSSR